MNQTIPPDSVLRDALRFARRTASYLYLPLLVVSLLVLLNVLSYARKAGGSGTRIPLEAVAATLAGGISVGMWRIARRPRATERGPRDPRGMHSMWHDS